MSDIIKKLSDTLHNYYAKAINNKKTIEEAKNMILSFFEKLKLEIADVIECTDGEVKIAPLQDEIIRFTIGTSSLVFKEKELGIDVFVFESGGIIRQLDSFVIENGAMVTEGCKYILGEGQIYFYICKVFKDVFGDS